MKHSRPPSPIRHTHLDRFYALARERYAALDVDVDRALKTIASIYGLAEEIYQESQPGGLPDISRGLSASDTPGTPSANEPHPAGVPEQSGQPQHVPSPLVIARFWHPSRVQMVPAFRSGGVASLRSAQPPANFCEPSGFVPPYYNQILNHT